MAFNIGPIDPECPCERDCPDRNAECHGKCRKYLDWRDKQNIKLEEKNQRHIASDTMSEAKKRAIWRKLRSTRQVRYNKGRDL